MRIHKAKYNKILEMLKKRYSYKQIAKELGVSISQIAEVAKIYDLYVETEEIKGQLEKIKKEKENELKYLQDLAKRIESLKVEIQKLEKRKIGLQNEIRSLESKWIEGRRRISNELKNVRWEITRAKFSIPISLPDENWKVIMNKLNNAYKIIEELLNQLEQTK